MKISINQGYADEHQKRKRTSYRSQDCLIASFSKGAIIKASNGDLVFIQHEMFNDHPVDTENTVDIVRFDYTITKAQHRDVPQEYIYRKRLALRSELLSKYHDVLKLQIPNYKKKGSWP